MKSFVVIAAVCLLLPAAAICADDMPQAMVGSAYGGGSAAAAAAPSSGGYGGGSASIPAPPCPKNYLFSCQPSLSPAPCSQGSSGYGSSGSYSESYPVYALPLAHYGGGYQGYNAAYQQY